MTKPTKTTCVLSEDSYQPAHLPGLIRVFAVHNKKHFGPELSIKRTAKTDQTGWIPRLI